MRYNFFVSSIFPLIFLWSVAALWAQALLWTHYCLKRQTPLAPANFGDGKHPLVSIIVPARNEAKRIPEKSLSSMLAQNYGNFELIVLNDRSTDETGKILRKIRERNRKLQIIDGAEPSAEWLGKPHALEQAFRRASGEWILATDADVVFAPETVSTAVSHAEELDLDALTLLPGQIYGSFWEKIFIPVFEWFCVLRAPLHRVNDPRRAETLGAGNFFMIRRGVLEKIGGFESVKSEVAEDLKLAEIIKSNGFRLRIDYAPDLIQTRMYASFAEIWSGFTKNFFPAMNFSFSKTFLGSLSIFLFGVLPLPTAILFFMNGNFALAAPLAAAYAFQTLLFALVRKKWRGGVLYAFSAPLGLAMFAAILINSAGKVLSGKGFKWKDRSIYEKGGAPPFNQ